MRAYLDSFRGRIDNQYISASALAVADDAELRLVRISREEGREQQHHDVRSRAWLFSARPVGINELQCTTIKQLTSNSTSQKHILLLPSLQSTSKNTSITMSSPRQSIEPLLAEATKPHGQPSKPDSSPPPQAQSFPKQQQKSSKVKPGAPVGGTQFQYQ
jgi:hypothetical protein